MALKSIVCWSIVALVLVPFTASAQQAGGIAGVVRDTSGGVLPGVTVDAASPVLIEQVRTVFTNGEGRYSIVDLRPGLYTVTFTLPGFSTVIREGVELTTGFTAAVNVDLQVGTLEETITVTGATPLVDVQNVRRQEVVSNELLEALPTSTKNLTNLVTLTAGFTGLSDVGGRYTTQVGGNFHGKSGTKVNFDGMGIENTTGANSYQVHAGVIEEMVLSTSGISAETNADGPVINVIPKEGGNTFSGTLAGFLANDKLESSNLTSELRSQGLTTSNITTKLWDELASVGGPLKQDKLWFFVTGRSWGFTREHAGVFWNKTQGTFLTPPGAERKVVLFTPDTDRPRDRSSGRWEWYDSYLTRITWQAADKHKLNFTYDEQRGCNCGSTSGFRAQERSSGYRFDPNRLLQATYTGTLTSRLLLEAGAGAAISQWNNYWAPGVGPDIIRIDDNARGISYGAAGNYWGDPNSTNHHTQRASVSYVTGSHNMKTGVHIEQYPRSTYLTVNGHVNYQFENGVPRGITQLATPYLDKHRVDEVGVYAQDQWTLDRLTLNLGLRLDYINGSVPAQDYPGETTGFAGAARVNPWIPPTRFEAVENAPSWKDISPRLGAAYDLFGDGRTALKVSMGRYVAKTNTLVTQAQQQINRSILSTGRSWTDANLDFVPDCDLGNFGANGECGGVNNTNFGQGNPNAVRWDDDVLRGWGARDANWDFTAELQHELLDGLSMTTGYYHNTAGYPFSAAVAATIIASKVRVQDNVLVGPSDFDSYCITAPVHPELPGGGGYEICDLADIKPEKFGQNESLLRRLGGSEEYKFYNDFFNLSFDARMPGGTLIGGGFDTGRSVADRCFVVDNPQELLHCRVITPTKAQTQFKVFGAIPLPADITVSGTYQNMSGPPFGANLFVSNAEVRQSLGRDLSGGRQSVSVPLVGPQTLFLPRVDRLDLRVSKVVNLGRVRMQVNVDAYNALNASKVPRMTYGSSVNNTFGSGWQRPFGIIDPRIVEIGGQIDF